VKLTKLINGVSTFVTVNEIIMAKQHFISKTEISEE